MIEPLEPKPVAPAHAGELQSAPEPAPSGRRTRRESVWETVRSLLTVLIAVFFIRTFVTEATVIPTGSMEKTILIGDHVFLDKLLYGPRLPFTSVRVPPLKTVRRQEIVAFRYPLNPSVMFVKRVIGVGGDLIRIKDKKVFVNGQRLAEPYAQFQFTSMFPLRDNFPPPVDQIATLPAAWGLDPGWAREMAQFIENDGLRVPPGYLFMMGDNRDNSLDSRFWGFVPMENVVGEPLFVYWSYDAPSRDWTAEDLTDRVRFNLSIVWNFIRRTRWSRTGMIF
ncbi:MAG: signal peptidase I [Acidobacteriia bacterium]|nr:signal peptidase I [Terriglobia bacterium]